MDPGVIRCVHMNYPLIQLIEYNAIFPLKSLFKAHLLFENKINTAHKLIWQMGMAQTVDSILKT